MTALRFEFRILSGDEVIAEDYTTFAPENIDQFGGCEMVDIHVASALRAVRRNAAEQIIRDTMTHGRPLHPQR